MQRAKHPCASPGCSNLTSTKYCDAHNKLQINETRQQQKRVDAKRDPNVRELYDARWARYSRLFRRKHPFCVICEREGRLVSSAVTDHIIPHRGDYTLFWDANNHQPLCESCHAVKTANEGGQWGRKNLGL